MLKSKGRHANRYKFSRERQFDELRGEKFTTRRSDNGRKRRNKNRKREVISEVCQRVLWAIRNRFNNALHAMNIKDAAGQLRRYVRHGTEHIMSALRQMIGTNLIYEKRMGNETVYSVNLAVKRVA